MLPKVVILLVCLSVVKAVYTVNAYEDDNNEMSDVSDGDETVVSDASAVWNKRSCGYEECNEFCRKLGYARGVCIGNYCQCRARIRAPEIAKPEMIDVYDGEEMVVSDASAVWNKRSCGYAECNEFCRKLGFARGVCIGTYCQCRALIRAPEILKPEMSDVSYGDEMVVSDASAMWNKRSCGYAECNEFCRKLGFARGVCIGTYCQCRALIRAPEIPKPEHTEVAGVMKSSSVHNCKIKQCNYCRKRGFLRGVCICTYCQCRTFRAHKPHTGDKRYVTDVSEVPIVSICQVSECNWYCHKRGYAGGVCISDTRCQCRMTLADKSLRFTSDDIPEALALKSCTMQDCEQSCRRLGFPGGVCVNGRCNCDILRSVSPLSESDFESDEIAEPAPRALKDCHMRACEQRCRRNGFRGEVCVNGRCICDILRSARPFPALKAFDDNIDEIANDANPEDDAAADSADSSENSVCMYLQHINLT